jgi:hypothetical protein
MWAEDVAGRMRRREHWHKIHATCIQAAAYHDHVGDYEEKKHDYLKVYPYALALLATIEWSLLHINPQHHIMPCLAILASMPIPGSTSHHMERGDPLDSCVSRMSENGCNDVKTCKRYESTLIRLGTGGYLSRSGRCRVTREACGVRVTWPHVVDIHYMSCISDLARNSGNNGKIKQPHIQMIAGGETETRKSLV